MYVCLGLGSKKLGGICCKLLLPSLPIRPILQLPQSFLLLRNTHKISQPLPDNTFLVRIHWASKWTIEIFSKVFIVGHWSFDPKFWWGVKASQDLIPHLLISVFGTPRLFKKMDKFLIQA